MPNEYLPYIAILLERTLKTDRWIFRYTPDGRNEKKQSLAEAMAE